MFLNHYIFTFYILWHTYHTLNAQFAEFHLCTPVVLNKVMDETVEFGGIYFLWAIQSSLANFDLQCNAANNFPLIFDEFFMTFFRITCMNQKHFVTPISSSRHTKFVVAFPCKFDPVWSGLIQFDPVSISSSQQLNYHQSHFAQCCFDFTVQAVLTHKIIHIFTIQKFRFLAPLEISPTSQPPPWNDFISCEFIDVSGTTYLLLWFIFYQQFSTYFKYLYVYIYHLSYYAILIFNMLHIFCHFHFLKISLVTNRLFCSVPCPACRFQTSCHSW